MQPIEECETFCAMICENVSAMPKMMMIMVEDWISPTFNHCWDIILSTLCGCIGWV